MPTRIFQRKIWQLLLPSWKPNLNSLATVITYFLNKKLDRVRSTLRLRSKPGWVLSKFVRKPLLKFFWCRYLNAKLPTRKKRLLTSQTWQFLSLFATKVGLESKTPSELVRCPKALRPGTHYSIKIMSLESRYTPLHSFCGFIFKNVLLISSLFNQYLFI